MRYDKKKKAEVVAFVKKHNQAKGRGGQSAAKKKYGISAITIAKWLTDAGETLPGKGGAKKATSAPAKAKPGRPKGKPGRPKGKPGRPKGKPGRPKGKPGRPKGKAKTKAKAKTAGRPKAVSSTSSVGATIQRLAEIDSQIQSLQKEFDALKKSL